MPHKYITYHQSIPKPDDVQSITPYEILSEELKSKLREYEAVQKQYYTDYNGFYFFIYLESGNRVDVML